MNGNHCWVGAGFGIELTFVTLENPNYPSASGLKEFSLHKHHELFFFFFVYSTLCWFNYRYFCRDHFG